MAWIFCLNTPIPSSAGSEKRPFILPIPSSLPGARPLSRLVLEAVSRGTSAVAVDGASVPGPTATPLWYSNASEYSDPLSDVVEDGRFSVRPSWFACESDIGIGELAGSFPGPAYLFGNELVCSCDWPDIINSLPSFSGAEGGLVWRWARSRLSWWLFWAFENRRVCRTTGSISREERSPLMEDQKQPQLRSRACRKTPKQLFSTEGDTLIFRLSSGSCEVHLPDLDRISCDLGLLSTAADSLDFRRAVFLQQITGIRCICAERCAEIFYVQGVYPMCSLLLMAIPWGGSLPRSISTDVRSICTLYHLYP